MSHNKITVGGKTPDSSGEIAVDLNDLSNVSGTPSTNDVLVYGGAGWSPAVATAGTSLPYSAFNPWTSHGVGSYGIPSGDWYSWRKFTARNSMIGGPYNSSFWVSSSIVHTSLSNSSWCMAFDLPAGLWFVRGTPNVRHNNTTNYIDLAWFDAAGNQYGNKARSMRGRPNSVTCWGVVDIASTTKIFLKSVLSSGAIYIPGATEHRSITFHFIKLG